MLLRNLHSLLYSSFAAFSILFGLWIPANFFGSYWRPDPALSSFFYMDFALAPLLTFSLAIYGFKSLEYYLRKRIRLNRVIFAGAFLVALLASISAFLHLVVKPAYAPDNVMSIKQTLYYPYIISILTFTIIGLATLLYSTFKSDSIYKQQTRIVLWGLTVAATVLAVSNLILPNLKIAQALSYFSILIMLLSLSYSIIRHRLFDLRLVVARSAAYILLITTLAVVFAASLLTVSALFFRDQNVSAGIKIVYLLVSLAMAFTFQPLKRLFDKTTNRIFYRDAYDTQVFIGQLNRGIVVNLEIGPLLNDLSRIIVNNMKLEYCVFILKDSSGSERLFGHNPNTSKDEVNFRFLTSVNRHSRIVVLDYAERLIPEQKEILARNQVGAIVKLSSHNSSPTKEHEGFMVLGIKKSGNAYLGQDETMLNTIANEVVIAIQNALQFEEIKQFNITLQEKIDAATKQLRSANSKLKELDATKDEFISMASHQLRTPLTTIKGYLSMILDGDVGKIKTDEKDLVQHAFDSAERMVYLIADLLNVSRLQSGKFVIDNKPTNLPQVVKGEVQQLKEQATNREINMNYIPPKEYPTLNLDETKIRQVIMNFLDNALYYTPKGGEVTVELSATGDSASLTITDTGVGVPKALQHHLFTKFYRAENARKMRPDGTGLGLYMAKKVVVAQGGAIIFKSMENKGSTFGFSFPRSSVEQKGTPGPGS